MPLLLVPEKLDWPSQIVFDLEKHELVEFLEVFCVFEEPANPPDHQIRLVFGEFAAPNGIAYLVVLEHLRKVGSQLVLEFNEIAAEVLEDRKQILVQGSVGKVKNGLLQILLFPWFHLSIDANLTLA